MNVPNQNLLVERIRSLSRPLSPISTDHSTRLNAISGIQCVAFDFYGTMFMSGVGDIGIDEEQKEGSEVFFTKSLQESGFKILNDSAGTEGLQILKQTLDRHISDAKERGVPYPEPEIRDVWRDTLTELLDRSMIDGNIDSSAVARFAVEFEFRINAIWPVPNLADLLRQLMGKNMKLGIISNSQFYTPLAFEALIGSSPEAFGFDPELLVWSFATGCKKPDPNFYHYFTERLEPKGLSPEEVLYVGNDIRKDIKPAKTSGMHTALFVGDRRSIRHEEEELNRPSYQPDLVVDELAQIDHCLA